jgi:hypothetical protein
MASFVVIFIVLVRSDNNATKCTFDLLARDHTVANGVSTLHLLTAPPDVFRNPWINPHGFDDPTEISSILGMPILHGCRATKLKAI